jgi:hypothetical protein
MSMLRLASHPPQVDNYFIIYPTCIDPSDKHKNLHKKKCKPFQNHAKCSQGILLHGNEVSDAFNHTLDGCFYEKYAKMHERIRNIARPRRPICHAIKISDQPAGPIRGKHC